MRDSLKTSVRWLGTGCFLALVLFTAPNCVLQTNGLGGPGDGNPNPCDTNDPKGCNPDCDPTKTECPPPCDQPECPPDPCDTPDCNMPPGPMTVFVQGGNPTSSIMCDFPNAEKPGVSNCATQAEVDSGVYLSQSTAATSLATTQSNALTLDWSPAALAECSGLPKKVEFLGGVFPDGQQVCIDPTQFPNTYANPTKACIARCEDVIAMGPGPIPADIHDYCVNNAHTSTNFDKNSWYPNSCTPGGSPIIGFPDPRRIPEPVQWTDHIGTTDNGGTNTLEQTSTVTSYLAGAASAQTISAGDAWVEFATNETDTGHGLGLRTSCANVVNCPDQDPTFDNLGYSINFSGDGQVYVYESATNQTFGPFGPYAAAERYRIKARDNHDGTATISYARIVGACPIGAACNEDQFYTSIPTVAYPLRVDATLRQQNSTLTNVTLVRIKE